MCFFSGFRDPTRVDMEWMLPSEMRSWARRLIMDQIETNWKFGMEPFSREVRAPEVSFSFLYSFVLFRFF